MFDGESTGAGGLRNEYVAKLREMYEVTVVTPNYYKSETVINDDYVLLPFAPRFYMLWLERIGIFEDYMDDWAKRTAETLSSMVKEEDIIFSTSGGELACIKAGYYVKEKTGCKHIVNFHDPVDYTHVNGIKTVGFFHVSRDRLVKKYASTADGIITWARDYAEMLKEWFPHINKIQGIYRGYRKCEITEMHREKDEFRIIYAGTMGKIQGLDKMIKIFAPCEGVTLELIGEPTDKIRKIADKYSNVLLTEKMSFSKCMNYMKREGDVGIVSIVDKEFGIATPSKLFDIINLEIPIIGIIPSGEGQDFINSGFGFAADVNDVENNRKNLRRLQDRDIYKGIQSFIKNEKPKWTMEAQFEEVYKFIDGVMEARETMA